MARRIGRRIFKPELVRSEADKESEVARLAGLILNQPMLEKVLADTAPHLRAGVLEKLKPHLPFTPYVDDGQPILDCPKCGLKRGSILPHECLVD